MSFERIKSIRFFALWLQGITPLLSTLDHLLRAASASQGVSVQGVQQRLLTPAPEPSSPSLLAATESALSSESIGEHKADRVREEIPAPEPATEGPLSISAVTPSLVALQAALQDSKIRHQQSLAESQNRHQRALTEIKESDRKVLEDIQQLGASIRHQLQQEREASKKQLQQVREQQETAERELAQAHIERLVQEHRELLRPSAPMMQARSSYFNFCWSDSSHTPQPR